MPAHFFASSSAWPSAASAVTKPRSSPSCAGTCRPVSIMPIAFLSGICRASRCMPPAAAASPTRGSGRANLAFSAAMMISQASATSKPPPIAMPFTAAITGLLRSNRAVMPPKSRQLRMDRPLARRFHQLGVILEIVAGAERLVASARHNCDPEIWVFGEFVKVTGQLLTGHRVEGVVDLRPVDRDDHQMAIHLSLTVLAHGRSSSNVV